MSAVWSCNDHCQRATHAEANAIVQGALHGVGLESATAYCTHQPCINCSKLFISAGIDRIVYEHAYPDPIAAELLAEAGVAIIAFASSGNRGPARVNVFTLIVTLVLAAGASAFATPLVARLATHVGMVDAAGDRRMHAQPKPRIGGVAVFFGIFVRALRRRRRI